MSHNRILIYNEQSNGYRFLVLGNDDVINQTTDENLAWEEDLATDPNHTWAKVYKLALEKYGSDLLIPVVTYDEEISVLVNP